MKKRFPYLVLLVAALGVWQFSDRVVIPWIEEIFGYNQIEDRDLSVLLGHWVFGQLPRVILCTVVWLIGTRFGLIPSFGGSFKSGGSWNRVIRTGLIATVLMLLITIGVGAAAGGTFGFHVYFTKMAGDLVSNMYEEIVYRGLMFSAFYGVAAAASFPLDGKLDRTGIIVGTIGSCIVFAMGHEQYSLALRVVIGTVSVLFVYPWVSARSLWAPWIPHTLVDFIGDSILKL